MSIDFDRIGAAAEEGIPVFVAAGTETEGEFYCAECGYGVAGRRTLPTCPMCGGSMWEPPGTSAFVSR